MALSFCPEVNIWLELLSAHLCSTSAVVFQMIAAESTPLPPPSVAKTFVMVLVVFGCD